MLHFGTPVVVEYGPGTIRGKVIDRNPFTGEYKVRLDYGYRSYSGRLDTYRSRELFDRVITAGRDRVTPVHRLDLGKAARRLVRR